MPYTRLHASQKLAELNVLTKDPDSGQDQGRTMAEGGCSPLVGTDWPLEPDEAQETATAL